jgi:hypothetical protein
MSTMLSRIGLTADGRATSPEVSVVGDLEQFSRHTEAHVWAYSVP